MFAPSTLPASNVTLSKRPFALSYGVWRILKDTCDFLFESKNKNSSIFFYYIAPLLNFYKTKDLKSLCHFTCSAKDLTHPYPLNRNGLALRVLVTHVFQKFTQHCWQHLLSSMFTTDTQRTRSYSRMMQCSPVGFQGRNRSCRHALCLNCHIRKAIAYRKEILKADSENNSAVVVKVETPFEEDLVTGMYIPVYPKVPNSNREYSLLDMLKRALNPKGKKALGKAVGITVDSRHPSICTCMHVLCREEDLEFKYEEAKKFAFKIIDMQKEHKTKVTVTKCAPSKNQKHLDVNTLTYLMYNNSPIRLLATSIKGFSASERDIFLETNVQEFCRSIKNKKFNIIKDV